MTDKPTTAMPTAAAMNAQPKTDGPALAMQKRSLLADIRGKWGKFTQQELSDLKGSDDLATKVAAKYSLAKDIAQRDVTTLLNGRAF
jgi:hypothetical protein